QHVRRANKERKSNLLRHFERVVWIGGHAKLRIGYGQFFKERRKAAAIFGQVERFERSTDNLDAVLVQFFCQLQRCLSAQLDDHACGLFVFDDIIEMFPEHGLEIQLVGNVEVSRDRLRIAVHHDRLVTAFFGSEYAVNTAIVEFNTLANTVRDRKSTRLNSSHVKISYAVF